MKTLLVRDSDRWTVNNRFILELACSVLFFAGGLFMAVRFSHSSLRSNEGAAFLLGTLLAVIGGLGLIFGGPEEVVIDVAQGTIRVSRSTLFGKPVRTIALDEIRHVSVSQLGHGTEGAPNYFLTLHLKNGKETNLFVGFYPGFTSRDIVNARRERLAKLIAERRKI